MRRLTPPMLEMLGAVDALMCELLIDASTFDVEATLQIHDIHKDPYMVLDVVEGSPLWTQDRETSKKIPGVRIANYIARYCSCDEESALKAWKGRAALLQAYMPKTAQTRVLPFEAGVFLVSLPPVPKPLVIDWGVRLEP